MGLSVNNRAVDKMENAKVEIEDGKDFQKEEDTLCKWVVGYQASLFFVSIQYLVM